MAPEMTGVVLNWERPNNVKRIVDGWQASGLVAEAIVWNNNPAQPFQHGWAKVINVGTDLGLYSRFAGACLAANEAVLLQDDDIELPSESLRSLLAAWANDPDVLHGIFGRRPHPDGSYGRSISGNAGATVILTRALIASRRYAGLFFLLAPEFETIQREGRPTGNGEDIIFSYVARHCSGRLNRTHDVAVTELPASNPIHGRDWKAHQAHRSRLLRACESWLQRKKHEDRRDLLHL